MSFTCLDRANKRHAFVEASIFCCWRGEVGNYVITSCISPLTTLKTKKECVFGFTIHENVLCAIDMEISSEGDLIAYNKLDLNSIRNTCLGYLE